VFEAHVRRFDPSDKELIAAQARADGFHRRQIFFAEGAHLPGGIKVWNGLHPGHAKRVLIKIMLERGIKPDPARLQRRAG